jgi:hypothetical protein
MFMSSTAPWWGSRFFVSLDRVPDFLAVYRNLHRAFDPESHAAIAKVDNGDRDVVANLNGLVLLSAEN